MASALSFYIFLFFCASYLALNLDAKAITVLMAFFLGVSAATQLARYLSPIGGSVLEFVRGSSLFISPLSFFFALALAQQNMGVQRLINAQLPHELDGTEFLVEGRVVSLPEREGPHLRFQMELVKAQSIAGTQFINLDGYIRLSWRTPNEVRLGEYWKLPVRLKRPRGFANPRGFDYQAWLISKGIVATGYVYGDDVQKLEYPSDFFQLLLIRDHVSAVLDRLLLSKTDSEVKRSELLRALLIGDKAGITKQQWNVFKGTGTIHLMAISGLHVGLIATLAAVLASLVLRPLVLVARPIYFRLCVASLSIASAFFYAQLAGFSLPTQRAFYCVALVNCILLLERRTSFLPLLGLIACIVLFINPFSLMQTGFVLSFAAVAILLFSFSETKKTTDNKFVLSVKHFLFAQFAIFIGLFPFMVLLNLPSPLVAPLANLIAIPLISFFVLPCAFLALAVSLISDSLSIFLFQCAGTVLDYLVRYLEFIAEFNSTNSWQYRFNKLDAVFLGISALLLLYPKRKVLHVACAALSLFVVLASLWFRAPIQSSITILDVGQGLASVVRGDRGTLVYDLGAKYSESFSVANQVVLPYLETIPHKPVKQLILSHADNDHAGGAHEFVEQLKEKQRSHFTILSGEADVLNGGEAEGFISAAVAALFHSHTHFHSHAHAQHMKDVLSCHNEMLSETISLKLLWPERAYVATENSNNQSCVLLIEMEGKKILFTGDIEKEVEYRLLERGLLPPNIDVLVAPHHGSATSSTFLFLQQLHPQHVIFSAGYKNRYRHPSQKIVARYEAMGVTTWNTAEHGAIHIFLEGGELKVHSERISNPKRWYLREE